MKLQILAALALSLLALRAAEPNQLTDQEKAEGWKLLFNGSDLTGWRLYNSKNPPRDGWQVAEGILSKVNGKSGGDIVTEATFTDFELSWEWRIAEKGNNGIKYLVTEERSSAPGPEYQLLDDNGHPDAKAGQKRQTASLYDILPPADDKPLKPVGEWNHSRIIIRGNQVEHWLNESKVLAYELGSDALKAAIAQSKFKAAPGFGQKIAGHIMLTDHSDQCDFRNLKIRELQAD
jgi:hypothetical protein